MRGDRSLIVEYDVKEDRIFIYDGVTGQNEQELEEALAESMEEPQDPIYDISVLTRAIGVLMRAAESAGVQPSSKTIRQVKASLDDMFADVNFNAVMLNKNGLK